MFGSHLHVKIGDACVGAADGEQVRLARLLEGKQVHAAAKHELSASAEAAAVPCRALSGQLGLGHLPRQPPVHGQICAQRPKSTVHIHPQHLQRSQGFSCGTANQALGSVS